VTSPTGPPARNRWFDRLLNPSRIVVGGAIDLVQTDILPAWRRTYEGEHAAPVLLALIVASVLQALLPGRVVHPVRWLFPSVAFALLVVLVAAHGARIHRASPVLRLATLLFMLVLSGANIAAAARLVNDLLRGEGLHDAGDLILTGGAIWLTNVIIFALWYWMFDRGGPVARAINPRPYVDFLFPQMTAETLAKPGWRPEFFDYLYTSFTNATAFSPTDVMPMSRWAKVTMMLQSAVALLLAILVIARAVNVLK
jgi:hypothetical protein